MDTPDRTEDLAQLLARLKDTYGVTETEIARRIGTGVSTVNSWSNRTRGGKRGPNREKLRALAREFPKFTEAEIFAAAGREAPGPLSPDAEARIIELWRGLTEEQQRAKLVELRALGEMNRTGQ
ncbi:helix-turn-helix domain-containing protein [Streptomyces sp. NBC_00566]|uniref:helix-turn-helix domain-containing protein n=1 Tax=Streptomyces sp. NBC_00566 TaxID=2975778 RepID=UPI002E8098F3|nr:helix-turn-helix transcriptional regulator [Streptomyces sp. NBC_00566]WUB88216.1 helix-turn-helix transcriptional regulator [Streptomyces sp. NBC_00566]